MNVTRIDFDNDGLPAEVHVRMTAREAAGLSVRLGKESPASCDEKAPGTHPITSALYGVLNSQVFNPYWEEGDSAAWHDLR